MDRRFDLADARDSLAYWEQRERSLPKRDRKGRREAAQHVARCRERVAAAEHERFGEGPVGTVMQLASEGRLPEPLRDTGRRVARHGRNAVVAAVALTAALTVLVVLACVAILLAIAGVI